MLKALAGWLSFRSVTSHLASPSGHVWLRPEERFKEAMSNPCQPNPTHTHQMHSVSLQLVSLHQCRYSKMKGYQCIKMPRILKPDAKERSQKVSPYAYNACVPNIHATHTHTQTCQAYCWRDGQRQLREYEHLRPSLASSVLFSVCALAFQFRSACRAKV